jgi:hypothetical protein
MSEMPDAYDRVTAHLDPPFALVDLDAFDANATDLAARCAPRCCAPSRHVPPGNWPDAGRRPSAASGS